MWPKAKTHRELPVPNMANTGENERNSKRTTQRAALATRLGKMLIERYIGIEELTTSFQSEWCALLWFSFREEKENIKIWCRNKKGDGKESSKIIIRNWYIRYFLVARAWLRRPRFCSRRKSRSALSKEISRRASFSCEVSCFISCLARCNAC